MDNSYFYTKGNPEDIITRINQIHSITVYCPVDDFCVRSLKDTLEIMYPGYKEKDNFWSCVPAIDALNAFIVSSNFQKQIGADVDTDIMGVIISSLKMFNRLKVISFQFTDDKEIMKTYKIMLKKEKGTIKKYIYRIDMLEMNLSDMFSQNIIDMLNRVFICNDVIPNSYLNRRFILDFNFNDYTSFMDMFIGNNKDNLDYLDKNICEYFRKFPKLVEEQKPMIRIITNYGVL